MNEDIQKELYELVDDMEVGTVYAQLTSFIVKMIVSENNPRTHAFSLSFIIGLLTETYLSYLSTEKVPALKVNLQAKLKIRKNEKATKV